MKSSALKHDVNKRAAALQPGKATTNPFQLLAKFNAQDNISPQADIAQNLIAHNPVALIAGTATPAQLIADAKNNNPLLPITYG